MKKKTAITLFYVVLISLFSCTKSKENNDTYEERSETKTIDSLRSVSGQGFDETDTLSDEEYNLLINEYEDPERAEWQNPELVLNKLGDAQNKIVADIGAGTGYFTFPLAAISKKVIAIDIEPTFLDYIEDLRLDYPRDISEGIETRLSEENDPMLRENEVDIVLMVNVYAYLNNRVSYLEKVKKGLRADGILLIVDFKKGDIPVGPVEELKIPMDSAVSELKKAGFTILEADRESLEYQYIVKAK